MNEKVRPEAEGKNKLVSVWMDPDTKERLRRAARRERNSMSGKALYYVDEGLRREQELQQARRRSG
uniref:Uncharacterized protein n=1 Tax=Candidatus Kentrum sp. LPFa TaxID=2126335 RepID=A0A450WD44_9GAMM|nr:MAG: hypothetical protein BECKLPF1236B_GA0070989_10716 [Candidatus Kentron sp. LPFa]